MDADYDPNAASLNDRNYGLDGRSKRSKRKKNRLKNRPTMIAEEVFKKQLFAVAPILAQLVLGFIREAKELDSNV